MPPNLELRVSSFAPREGHPNAKDTEGQQERCQISKGETHCVKMCPDPLGPPVVPPQPEPDPPSSGILSKNVLSMRLVTPRRPLDIGDLQVSSLPLTAPRIDGKDTPSNHCPDKSDDHKCEPKTVPDQLCGNTEHAEGSCNGDSEGVGAGRLVEIYNRKNGDALVLAPVTPDDLRISRFPLDTLQVGSWRADSPDVPSTNPLHACEGSVPAPGCGNTNLESAPACNGNCRVGDRSVAGNPENCPDTEKNVLRIPQQKQVVVKA
jgi:hypothetical protein